VTFLRAFPYLNRKGMGMPDAALEIVVKGQKTLLLFSKENLICIKVI